MSVRPRPTTSRAWHIDRPFRPARRWLTLDFNTVERLLEADSIANETRFALKDVEDVLAAANCTLKVFVKTAC